MKTYTLPNVDIAYEEFGQGRPILENYPRASFVVLDRSGHSTSPQQAELLKALVHDWLDRVEEVEKLLSGGS